jgi:hypothetical protein
MQMLHVAVGQADHNSHHEQGSMSTPSLQDWAGGLPGQRLTCLTCLHTFIELVADDTLCSIDLKVSEPLTKQHDRDTCLK